MTRFHRYVDLGQSYEVETVNLLSAPDMTEVEVRVGDFNPETNYSNNAPCVRDLHTTYASNASIPCHYLTGRFVSVAVNLHLTANLSLSCINPHLCPSMNLAPTPGNTHQFCLHTCSLCVPLALWISQVVCFAMTPKPMMAMFVLLWSC